MKTAPKLGPSNGTIFGSAFGHSYTLLLRKKKVAKWLASPVPSHPRTTLSRESFALSPKKQDCLTWDKKAACALRRPLQRWKTVVSNNLRTQKQPCNPWQKCTCPCSRTKSVIAEAVAGSSRNKAIIQTERHPCQKSPSACTTLKLGGAWGGLSSKPTYNLLDVKLMKNGPSRIWKWWLGKMWKWLDHD